ncbi:hypothetical protein AB205_0222210 [Aquarana catesbeiana]|uniref:Uncharacterized protein n=1 Tax=Aquarana catesbeiana TaxID=8400 RepID=A0A2G9R8C5_AQUCT|nr:hypothetical protein AB205_0222210 [Aquarana catesbeiana]
MPQGHGCGRRAALEVEETSSLSARSTTLPPSQPGHFNVGVMCGGEQRGDISHCPPHINALLPSQRGPLQCRRCSGEQRDYIICHCPPRITALLPSLNGPVLPACHQCSDNAHLVALAGMASVNPHQLGSDNPHLVAGDVASDNLQMVAGDVASDNLQMVAGDVASDNLQMVAGDMASDNPHLMAGDGGNLKSCIW